MKLSVAGIARIINGKIHGPRALQIKNIAPPDEATRNDLTFIFEQKTKTKAGVVISTLVYPGKITIIVKDPRAALYKLLKSLSRTTVHHYIADTAVIEKGVSLPKNITIDNHAIIKNKSRIGDHTRIGSNCLIDSNVTIGSHCRINPNSMLFSGTMVGNHAVIGAGTVIGSPGFGFMKKKSYYRYYHIGMVKIGDYVEIGANCTIDRATIGKTFIGTGTKIDNLVHIAHNVKIGRNCLIMGQCGIAGSSRLGDNVILCGQVGISDHVNIGDGVIVCAKSAVFRSIPRNLKVSGIPAREHRAVLKALARLYRDE